MLLALIQFGPKWIGWSSVKTSYAVVDNLGMMRHDCSYILLGR